MRFALLCICTACYTPYPVVGIDDPDAAETDAPAEEQPPEDDSPPDPSAEDSAPEETEPPASQGVTGDQPFDTCRDARQAGPLVPGDYAGSMRGFQTSGLGPSCFTFPWTNGADAFFKVVIPNGQTITAFFEAYGRDSQVYLLADCADGSTCIAGSDEWPTGSESFSFTNDSGSDQTAYLVLGIYNAATPPQEYDLSVRIE
jgi:hypothetical protein